MTRLYLIVESTQSFWIFCIKFDVRKKIENCTVLEEISLIETIKTEKVRS